MDTSEESKANLRLSPSYACTVLVVASTLLVPTFLLGFLFSLSAPETSSGDRHKERRDAKEPLAKALKAASFKSENSAKIKMDHGTIGAL